MDIALNFINNSNDANNSQIVIFQKNEAADALEQPVAWKVIENCGPLDNHPFVLPLANGVTATDRYGNFMPMLDAQAGGAFHVLRTDSGCDLSVAGPAPSARETHVANQLTDDVINAYIYKGGTLLAARMALAPGQVAAFAFAPTIWIVAVPPIRQGEVMGSGIVSQPATELSLEGIASADIVMTGGGPGASATPLAFTLENVVMA
jgi:hypothetical protein